MEQAEAQALVDSRVWYHDWEIVPGVRTNGGCYVGVDPSHTRLKPEEDGPGAVLDMYGFPERMDGMRVLDIGAWDGPYSFEMERRGAEVVSMDIQSPDSCGYNTAHKILGSKCQHIQGTVYDVFSRHIIDEDGELLPECNDMDDIQRKTLGQFDLILYMGVYYHLKEPMRAWEAIKSVMKPHAIMYFEGLILDYAWVYEAKLTHRQSHIEAIRDLPVALFSRGEFGYDETNFYIPTLVCVYDWLLAAGYKVISIQRAEVLSRCWGAVRLP